MFLHLSFSFEHFTNDDLDVIAINFIAQFQALTIDTDMFLTANL